MSAPAAAVSAVDDSSSSNKRKELPAELDIGDAQPSKRVRTDEPTGSVDVAMSSSDAEQRLVPFDAAAQKAALAQLMALTPEQRMVLLQEAQTKTTTGAAAAAAAESSGDEEEEEKEDKNTTARYMKHFRRRLAASWARLDAGEEVCDIVDMEEAFYLQSKHGGWLLDWNEFRDIKKSVGIWKGAKNTTPYATLEVKIGDQKFGPRAVEFPDKFVVAGPAMVAEYVELGEEGNYHKIGKENGPAGIEALTYNITLTNAKYSDRVADRDGRNPLANAFFDWLDKLLEHLVRSFWDKGGFGAFRAFVEKDVLLENTKKKADWEARTKKARAEHEKKCAKAAKDGASPPEPFEADEEPAPVKPPASKEDWIALMLSSYLNPATKLDTNRDLRSTSLTHSIYKRLKKRKDDPSNQPIGEDTAYVPPHTEHGVFRAMFAKTQLENGKDMQRKQHLLPYYRPLGANEELPPGDDTTALRVGGWTYVLMATPPKVRAGDVIKPLISFNFYDWISERVGMTRHIWGLIYMGHKGQLYDKPPTPCDPLRAMPMVVPPSAAAAAAVDAAEAEDDVAMAAMADMFQ